MPAIECVLFAYRPLERGGPHIEDIAASLTRDVPTVNVARWRLGEVMFSWAPLNYETERLLRHPGCSEHCFNGTGAQLRISLALPALKSNSSNVGQLPAQQDKWLLAKSVYAFGHALAKYMLVSDLAYPDALWFQESLLFVDGEPCAERVTPCGLMSGLEWVDEFEQPALAPAHVYQWLLRLPGFTQGAGLGAYGRAVSALAHLQQPDTQGNEVQRLIWTVIGLEALRAADSDFASEGVRQSLRPMLGPSEEIESVLGRMYRLRSEVIHGRADLPLPWYLTPDNDFDRRRFRFLTGTFDSRLPAALEVGLTTLILTLRHRIAEDLASAT